jgi:surfactin synthase thioesterase subunit
MQWVLLPGFDGTGLLFEPLTERLPRNIEVRVVSYPQKSRGRGNRVRPHPEG